MKNSVCKYKNKCGGCRYQGFTYEEQLQSKQKWVTDLLSKFAKVDDIVGAENPYFYRNKIHSTFANLPKGEVTSGTYEEHSHRLVPIDKCLIQDEKADEIILTMRKLAKSFKMRAYDVDKGQGLLRHVLIRTGKKSGEILLVLVLSSHIFPGKKNFVKAIRKEHPEITSIVVNVNDKKTSMILGDREFTIYGKGFIVDELCGKNFKISPKSFYQINHDQTEKLYNKALEVAEFKGHETILDAYSGTGTIGIIAADSVKDVISVELNKDAHRDAVMNAKKNGVNNIRFFNADAGQFCIDLANHKEKIDAVIMDPPRSGSDENFINSVLKLSPEKVIYISCNPETLARDLNMFTGKYEVKSITPFDLFPWTGHVESVVLMSKKEK